MDGIAHGNRFPHGPCTGHWPLVGRCRTRPYPLLKQGDIAIGHAWAPPTENGAGAVYLPLLNRGAAPDRLVGASTPIAREVPIRVDKDGEARWPEAIPLVPGKPIALAYGSFHEFRRLSSHSQRVSVVATVGG